MDRPHRRLSQISLNRHFDPNRLAAKTIAWTYEQLVHSTQVCSRPVIGRPARPRKEMAL
jgi:hypothetical protein